MLGAGVKLKSAFKLLAETDGDSCFTSEDVWKDIESVYECLIPVYRLAKALSSALSCF